MDRPKVVIDGVEWVPLHEVISNAAMVALNNAYAISWCYSVYDPEGDVEKANAHLREISDHLSVVNKELHFKA